MSTAQYATVEFDVRTPVGADELGENIASALALGLPEVDCDRLMRCVILANGPSLTPLVLGGVAGLRGNADVFAVNGALKSYAPFGTPDYWVACDPQPLVADFLNEIPLYAVGDGVTYLVASKCHPDVFARLQGRAVMLWHVDDHPSVKALRPIPVASSVTLCAIQLARRMGYRSMDVYGWDGCYEPTAAGMKHHADAPEIPTPPDVVTVHVGAVKTADGGFAEGRPFATTPTWAVEAQDAVAMLQRRDFEIRVHGDGMIKAILELSGVL